MLEPVVGFSLIHNPPSIIYFLLSSIHLWSSCHLQYTEFMFPFVFNFCSCQTSDHLTLMVFLGILLLCPNQANLLDFIIIIIIIIIIIYTAKSHLSIPKRHIYIFCHAFFYGSASHEVLLFSYVRCPLSTVFFGQRPSSILKRFPYH